MSEIKKCHHWPAVERCCDDCFDWLNKVYDANTKAHDALKEQLALYSNRYDEERLYHNRPHIERAERAEKERDALRKELAREKEHEAKRS